MEAGDGQVLWGDIKQISTAVDRYKQAAQIAAESGAAQFRLGVALRMRFDSSLGNPDDFQSAVNAWGRALDIDPNHYIYRRRIQQYGPRLIKPYPFYDWIQQARVDMAERGDKPLELVNQSGPRSRSLPRASRKARRRRIHLILMAAFAAIRKDSLTWLSLLFPARSPKGTQCGFI
jgi:hypothetical protein